MVLPEQGVALGLDLQGGIHLVLEVEEERAVEIALDRLVRAVQDLLADKNQVNATLLSLVPFLLIFVIFYFLLIRPQQQRQKQQRRH